MVMFVYIWEKLHMHLHYISLCLHIPYIYNMYTYLYINQFSVLN